MLHRSPAPIDVTLRFDQDNTPSPQATRCNQARSPAVHQKRRTATFGHMIHYGKTHVVTRAAVGLTGIPQSNNESLAECHRLRPTQTPQIIIPNESPLASRLPGAEALLLLLIGQFRTFLKPRLLLHRLLFHTRPKHHH